MYCTRTRHGVIVWPRWRNVFLSNRFQAFPSWRARVLSRTAAVRIQSAGACVLLKRIFSYFFFFLCFFLLLDETRTVDALIHTCSQHGNLYIFPNGPPPHGGPVSVVVPLPRRAAATTFCRRVSRTRVFPDWTRRRRHQYCVANGGQTECQGRAFAGGEGGGRPFGRRMHSLNF